MFDVRHFWLPKGKSKLAPSDKGVSMPVEQVEMFITILQEVRATIQPNAKAEVVYYVTAPTSDFNWKSWFTEIEQKQEEIAFISDPDYVASSTGKRFANLEV